MKTPHCWRKECRAINNLYVVRRKNGVPVLHMCRGCNTKQKKEYRKTDKGRKATIRAVLRYQEQNELRKKVWGQTNYRIPVSKPCIVCGDLPVHKHHPDINRPLEVVFLCPLHHKQAERELVL